jgi:hypothetical protein
VRITGITVYMLLSSPKLGVVALSIVPVVAIVNKFYGDWLGVRTFVFVEHASTFTIAAPTHRALPRKMQPAYKTRLRKPILMHKRLWHHFGQSCHLFQKIWNSTSL